MTVVVLVAAFAALGADSTDYLEPIRPIDSAQWEREYLYNRLLEQPATAIVLVRASYRGEYRDYVVTLSHSPDSQVYSVKLSETSDQLTTETWRRIDTTDSACDTMLYAFARGGGRSDYACVGTIRLKDSIGVRTFSGILNDSTGKGLVAAWYSALGETRDPTGLVVRWEAFGNWYEFTVEDRRGGAWNPQVGGEVPKLMARTVHLLEAYVRSDRTASDSLVAELSAATSALQRAIIERSLKDE